MIGVRDMMRKIRKKSTRTGLPKFLPSTLRTVKLKELAEKRARRLNILRKFIETILTEEITEEGRKGKIGIEDFVQSLDLKQGTWSRLERAESCLSIEVAQWIAMQALKKYGVFVTSEWLLGEMELSEDLPRVISKAKFEIYEYLRDIYKIEDLSKELSEEESKDIEEIYGIVETTGHLIKKEGLEVVIKKLGESLISKEEIEKIKVVLKREDVVIKESLKNIVIEEENGKEDKIKILKRIKNTKLSYEEMDDKRGIKLTKEECSMIKGICRRLIISSNITEEERSKRRVLSSYFISDLFQKINPRSMITYVRDNKMAPIFCKGDIVGGNIIEKKEIRNIDKAECIIELKNNIKIIRIVHVVSLDTIITGTNQNETTPEVYGLNEIESIAIILFRYKNLERPELNVSLDDSHIPTLMSFDDIKFF